jgi:hypothetical protein
MAHNYDNDPEFIEKIERFLNIRSWLITINDVSEYNIVSFWPLYNYITADFDTVFMNSSVISSYRRIFWENKVRPYSDGLHIAVHIRRPNICDDRIDGADTPDSYYLGIIEKIRLEYPGEKTFHIYSQGSIENFGCYCHKDCVLHLDLDLCDSFLGLVSADILVTSKSAFSYSAAMLTDGIVYFIGLGVLNPGCSRWILC